MAILQSLTAWLGHSIGKVANSAFSWATLLLFGKVPKDKQLILSVISLMSVLWLFTAIGIFFPRAGTFMLTMIPIPSWFNTTWISVTMAVLALAIPFGNGFASRFLKDSYKPKQAVSAWGFLMEGWKLTLALSLTLVLLIIIAPINKLGELCKRWTSQHIPVLVEPKDYTHVVDQLCIILESSDISCKKEKPSLIMQAPVWLLVAITGNMLKELVADKLTKLTYSGGELEIRPTDLIIRGIEKQVNHVLAIVSSKFLFGSAYHTWTKEANELEDRMFDLWKLLRDGRIPKYIALMRAEKYFNQMNTMNLDFEEFQTLYRLWLKLKLDIWEGISEAELKAS